MKILRFIWPCIGVLVVLFSCNSDETYVSLPIETQSDSYQVLQNTSIELNVLINDINIPSGGTISFSNASNGALELLNLNTPNNISDDKIKYTPNPNYVGLDSFNYTICEGTSANNCSTSSVTINVLSNSVVNFDFNSVPYETLSEYNFFQGNLKDLDPTFGVIPYDLNSPLFSDYAHKKRFIWMPQNTKATYVNDYSALNFPSGTVLIKNFYYDNVQPSNTTKIIETRLMYKTDEGWNFAKYVWNEEQTEATFTNDGSFVNFQWFENTTLNTVNYRIPSLNECFTCHNKFGTPLPIGPKPQNLNRPYNYIEGEENQLAKWIELGYLENNLPSTIVSTVNWEDETLPLDIRVRSYIDINCAHCHADESYCEYRPMRFPFYQNDDDTNMGICVTPDTQVDPYTNIIVPGNINESLLHFRISTVEEQYRMPILGRTLKHTEGVRLIEDWINSLTNDCN